MTFLTDRLHLRPLVAGDADALYQLDRDPEVMRFIGSLALPDPEAYRERLIDWTSRGDGRDDQRLFLAVEVAATNEWIGWFHLRPALDFRFAEEAGYRDGEHDLGYRFRRAAWGVGYASEGASALVRRAMRERAVRRVVSSALIGNVASIQVMRKAGLRHEAYFQLPGYAQVSVRHGTPTITSARSR